MLIDEPSAYGFQVRTVRFILGFYRKARGLSPTIYIRSTCPVVKMEFKRHNRIVLCQIKLIAITIIGIQDSCFN